MHDIILEATKIVDDKKLKDIIKQLEKKYDYGNIIKKRGRIIGDMIQIRRNEDEKSHHSLFEDWDFSLQTIKEIIKQGEKDAESTYRGRRRS